MSAIGIPDLGGEPAHGEAAQVDRGDKVQLLGLVLGMFAVLVVLATVVGVTPPI
jgi:hypothetical protein